MAIRPYHGQRPRWTDPNVEHREQLQRGILRTPPAADPLGLALKARARESSREYERQREEADPLYRLSDAGFNQRLAAAQMDFSGWGGFFQALQEAAQRLAGPNAQLRLVGGASPEGSTQVRGTSVQPGTIPGGIAGRPEWWLQGEAQPTTVTPETAARIRRNLDLMPPSLQGLYAAGLVKPRRR